jgi:hypothetical protein
MDKLSKAQKDEMAVSLAALALYDGDVSARHRFANTPHVAGMGYELTILHHWHRVLTTTALFILKCCSIRTVLALRWIFPSYLNFLCLSLTPFN